MLHSKIIRDADKLDNYRVKKEEKIEAIFPKRVNKKEDMEESLLSDKVYETILTDFDGTITKDSSDSSWASIFKNPNVTDEFVQECIRIFNYYHK